MNDPRPLRGRAAQHRRRRPWRGLLSLPANLRGCMEWVAAPARYWSGLRRRASLRALLPRLSALRPAPRPPRTPTILQMNAVECGAVSLAIVLAHHGREIGLDVLRAACGVSRDGSKAANILRAARAHGLEARGMRLDTAELAARNMPLILFWKFNHFLVFEGFHGGRAWLNDPACGPRQVTMKEFDQAYTGVALCLEPGPRFQRDRPARRSPGMQIPAALKPGGGAGAVSFILVASLALALPALTIPVFTQIFVDSVLIARLDGWIRPLLLGMGLTLVLRSVLTWMQQNALLRLEVRLAMASSATFMWHVLRVPMSFFQQRHAADLVQRMLANDRVAQLLCGSLASDAIALVTVVFTVLIMLTYDWYMTLVSLLLTALNGVALKTVARVRTDASLCWQTDSGVLSTGLVSAVGAIETIKAGGGERDYFQRWAGQQARVNNTVQRLNGITNLMAVIPFLLSACTIGIILWIGGLRVMRGDMTVGMLVGFQSLMLAFMLPVKNLMATAGNFQQAMAGLQRIGEVLRTPLERRFVEEDAPAVAGPGAGTVAGVAAKAGAETTAGVDPASAGRAGAGKLQGHLELRDLRFGYSRLEPPLVDGVSLRIAPGQRVALVGPSGSGKSTVARLVVGQIAPWSGDILFDGKPREAIAPALLHASLGGVDQDIYLFQGSVRENLTLWDSTLPEADMVQAAQDALIHDTIATRPGGYDALLDEDGSNFSGGQRQRLEIARVLAINPSLLVLDEATSALDTVMERDIDGNLRRRGCSCLIVAHRLSTIRDCDEIIVMEHGRVVERGIHEDLLRRGGAYARLCAAPRA
jgi:NHLM bacteriocin system ABC transporter peptidase/ATP-binding protein